METLQNKIKVKFEVEIKHYYENYLEEETIEVTWTNSTVVDIIYLQIYNHFNHKIFHAFMTHKMDVHEVFLRLIEEPGHYRVHAYGLKQCNKTSVPYYIIKNAASSDLESLLVEGKELLLLPEFEYKPLDDSDQSNYGIDVDADARHLTKYAFKGFRQGSFYIIFLQDLHSKKTYLLNKLNDNAKVTSIPFDLQTACEFRFQSFLVEKGNETSYLGNSHSTVCKFRSYMTYIQLQQLLNKAVQFVGLQRKYLPLTHFYRNKSYMYFLNTLNNHAGVMKKGLKDCGGDQFSALNGKLCGLFFSAVVDPKTVLPPAMSYFGPLRLYVPTYLLLNNTTNLYFSDFCCHYKNHKVQLVITKKGSNSDKFCSKRLTRLHPFCNDFWMMSDDGVICVTTNVVVEIFYTQDIPLSAWLREHTGVYFEETIAIGNARTQTGISKRMDCTKCNLDHVIRARTK